MYEYPVRYFEENLIWNRNHDCWACYQIEGISYEHLSVDKKISTLNAITRFIANIGQEAKIMIIPVAQDVKGHYDRLIADLDQTDPLYPIALNHAKGTSAYLQAQLEEYGANNDYLVYILTKLPKVSRLPGNLKKFIDEAIKQPIKTINEFMGANEADIPEYELHAYQRMADAFYQSASSRLRLKKTDVETTQWLIKRQFRRGLSGSVQIRRGKDGEPWHPLYSVREVKDGEKVIRPYERDILTLTESNIQVSTKGLKITNSDGQISYQTFLTIANIPDGILFPGGEWLLMLQDYSVASEICIHMERIEHKAAGKKLDNKRQEIDSQVEYVAQNDRVPDDLWDAQRSVSELAAELKPAADPLINTSISICIAADNEDAMHENAKFIRERYEDATFSVERPMTDQLKLFMEFIPGAGRYLTDYVLPLPPRTIAGSMFPATSALGDMHGHYIGTTGILRKNVYLSLLIACLTNHSASAVFLGKLGVGKSFNANLITLLHVLMGAYALIIDPKGERSRWPDALPGLRDEITITTLSAAKEDEGKLDPFSIFADNLDEACDLAKNILCELYEITSKDDEYIVLSEALTLIQHDERPSMIRLAELLQNFDDSDQMKPAADRLARRITSTRKIGMGRLLFGDGTQDGLSMHKRINILQVQNLNLPERFKSKADYSEAELISTVLMIPIAAFAKKFSMSNRKVFKITLFDEFWALNATQAGASLANFLARMGRSLNATVVFNGHSVLDIGGEGIKAAITYKFCFQTTDSEEILRILDFLDLEATDDNIAMVKKLPNRTCLFQDLDGRVGVLEFDAVWQDFIDAFNTTPGEEVG